MLMMLLLFQLEMSPSGNTINSSNICLSRLSLLAKRTSGAERTRKRIKFKYFPALYHIASAINLMFMANGNGDK